jgi:hypothetical protein
MCQQCIGQGVEPSVFYRQWAESEVGKEMLERSARIAALQGFIEDKQNELSVLEETQRRQRDNSTAEAATVFTPNRLA